MKKCPFCKAEIEENARFCLYCMKPLNEKEVILPTKNKKPWWLLIVVGALVLALLLAVLLPPKGQEELPGDTNGGETTASNQTTGSETAESTGETTQDTQPDGEILPEETGSKELPKTGTTNTNQTPEETPDDVTPEPSENEKPITTPTPSTKPEPPTQSTTPSTTPEETTAETTEPEETTAATTEPEIKPAAAAYTYRAARAGDDFNANYTNSGNDIVITGVAQRSADGVYNIPSYIDGKKVIAIVANAFYGSNAKVVYVPTTLKSIWNYAFNGCALTDIYFTHNIYIQGDAFYNNPVVLTIHCPENCQDRNFRYYKNKFADDDTVTWKEWNG